MSSKRVTTSIVAMAALALAVTETTDAFAPTAVIPQPRAFSTVRFAEETKESAFVPADNSAADNEESDEDVLSTVEMLGRGAAKVRIVCLYVTCNIPMSPIVFDLMEKTHQCRVFMDIFNRPSVESAREDHQLLHPPRQLYP